MQRGLEYDIFRCTELGTAIAEALLNASVEPSAILAELKSAAYYEDDEHWSERLQRELDLGVVELRFGGGLPIPPA